MTPTPNAPRTVAASEATDGVRLSRTRSAIAKRWNDARWQGIWPDGAGALDNQLGASLAVAVAEFVLAEMRQLPNAPTAAQVERAAVAIWSEDQRERDVSEIPARWRGHYEAMARRALTAALAAPASVAAGGEEV